MNPFWTAEEHTRLEKAPDLNELADVALIILERMSLSNREIVQICGPMTTGGLGSREANMARFQLAIERALQNGLFVFDQLPFQAGMIRLSAAKAAGQYDMGILEIFYRKVFESGYIGRTLFLPLWQSSTGTTWEYARVTRLGIIVEDYPAAWLE